MKVLVSEKKVGKIFKSYEICPMHASTLDIERIKHIFRKELQLKVKLNMKMSAKTKAIEVDLSEGKIINWNC